MNPGTGDLKLLRTPSLAEAMTAALNIILAYGSSSVRNDSFLY